MSKRYALNPGTVVSKHDGQEHWITASQLAKLYGLKPGTWIELDIDRPETFFGRNADDYIHLYPRMDGHYEVDDV